MHMHIGKIEFSFNIVSFHKSSIIIKLFYRLLLKIQLSLQEFKVQIFPHLPSNMKY